MANDFIAKASTTIQAPAAAVWEALVDPEKIREYMFGTTVETDWREGSPITWKGEWKGKPSEDKGTILRSAAPRILEYTHFSPLTGEPDLPENYHTVTIELAEAGPATHVTLTQNHNATEEARQESEKNWTMMLDGIRKIVEAPSGKER
jgi:uncharacterized protein YndB with AHSA1/START domain